MTSEEKIEKIIGQLERLEKPLREKLDRQGGRGVELANKIDRISMAIDALRGELQCPHCEAVLTGV